MLRHSIVYRVMGCTLYAEKGVDREQKHSQ